MKPYLRTTYDNHEEISNATGLECKDESLTQQHQKDETDINLIVKRYMQTGELIQHNMPPLMEDFEGVMSMQDAMNLTVEARMAFMEQPADVRSRFNNEPAKFVEFCSNEDNRGEMIKLGLLSPEASEAWRRQQVEIQNQIDRDRKDAEAYRKAQEGPKS